MRFAGRIHLVAIGAMLAIVAALPSHEPWELWEERIVGQQPLEMVFVERLPSPEACYAKASGPWSRPVPAGVTRLGYTCLPASPASGSGDESVPPERPRG